MKTCLRLALGVVVALASTAAPVGAHRLDEYLQATRLGIERDRLHVEITLTPGASIASQVVGLIDSDGNGLISDEEATDYARRVLESLTLTIDGRALALRMERHEFPEPAAMTAGVGAIRIRGSARISTAAGRHHLAFGNAHLPQISAYLVNALAPSDPRITIGAPHRDRVQRALDVDFDVEEDSTSSRAAWIVIALALLGTLATVRRQHAIHAVARVSR